MSEDLSIWHNTWHAIALLINHDRRYAHHETSITQLRLHALNGVARTAGQAIAVERTVKCGTWVKGARQNADWIVAAVTMACVFNPLCPDQDIDTGAVKRCPESIGMQRLTPLMVCLLVAMAAVFSIRKGSWFKKVATLSGRVSGQRNIVFRKGKTICFSNLVSVCLAYARFCRTLVLATNCLHAQDAS